MIDADFKGASVKVNNEKLSIIQVTDGKDKKVTKVLKEIPRSDPDYEKTLENLIDGMKEPVVLSDVEYGYMKSDIAKFNSLVQSRIPSENKSDAEIEFIRNVRADHQRTYDELHEKYKTTRKSVRKI